MAGTQASAAGPANDFPHPGAIQAWRKVNPGPDTDLASFPHAQFACPLKAALYPTHPQQITKQYARHLEGDYDTSKIRADDDVCKIGQKYSSGPKGPVCFTTFRPEYFVQSDLYMDRCGNFYRGFWEKKFLDRDENQGSLLALGRVVYMKGEAPEFRAEIANTYEVKPSEFLFLTPASSSEMQQIDRFRAEALKSGFHFDEQTFLFRK